MRVQLYSNFFQKIHTTLLQDLRLFEFPDVEPRLQRADCKVIQGFSTAQRVGVPNSCVVQGSAVYILIISEAGEGSNRRVIVQGEYEEKKRAKHGGCGTPAFRVYMFWQRSGKLLLKRRDCKG